MELSFVATQGKRVYQEFSTDNNVSQLRPIPNKPIWRGWDFGYHHPACVWAQPTPDDKLHVLAELMGEDTTIDQFAQDVKKISNHFFLGYKFQDAGDPAVRQVSDKSERTTADILRLHGIRIQSRPTQIKDGVNLIRRMLRPDRNGHVTLVLDNKCEVMIDAFLGGYVRREVSGVVMDEPQKDGYYEHIMDALRYMCVILYDVRTGHRLKIGRPYVRRRPTADPVTGY